jgi:membrane protease YdiL (CAAX protease family)
MNLNINWKKIVLVVICFAVLLAIPLFYEIYYMPFYSALLVLLLLIAVLRLVYEQRLEARFYRRWEKARKKGFLINFLRGGLLSMFFMIAVVLLGQFFVNGLNPAEIVTELSSGILIVLCCILLFFSAVCGAVYWHQNENRYFKMYFKE